MVTCFGIITISTAFVKSYSGLIATRVFLGIAEGGTLVRPISMILCNLALSCIGLVRPHIYRIARMSFALVGFVLTKMNKYYRRTELVMRIGIFFGVSAPLAGACKSQLFGLVQYSIQPSWRPPCVWIAPCRRYRDSKILAQNIPHRR